jgi:hypothetical protein
VVAREAPAYRFRGFRRPNYTSVPDELFDELAPNLTEAELRCLLYIVRRTFGFKKDADAISVNQMAGGIVTHEGRVLDHGTGLSRSAVWRGVKGLVEKGVIVAQARQSAERGNEPTVYTLVYANASLSLTESTPGSGKERPLSAQQRSQETALQETGDVDQTWSRVLEDLSGLVNGRNFQVWRENARLRALEGGVARVAVPAPLLPALAAQKGRLATAFARVLGRPVRVELVAEG